MPSIMRGNWINVRPGRPGFSNRYQHLRVVRTPALARELITGSTRGGMFDDLIPKNKDDSMPNAFDQFDAAPAAVGTNVEVLGDRVRCDVRYQELKLPPAQYQAFKRKYMGSL